MAQRYDVSLKSLFQREGDGLIRRVLFGSRVTELLSTEQPQIFNHRADMVARTEDGKLRHVEFQAANETAFHFRMLEYYAYLVRMHEQHVTQVVLYLGREPLRMENRFTSESIDYRFEIVSLRDYDAALLLASDDWADNALALLAKGEPAMALETLLPRLRAMQNDEQNWAAATLLLLSGILGVEQIVGERLEEVGMINVMENKVLGPIIQQKFEQGIEQGLEQGLEQGRAKGHREFLQEQLVEKFGNLPPWAARRLDTASSEALHDWAKRILRSNTLEDTLI